jgi:hypothetical protein
MLAGSFPEPSRRMPAAARLRWFAGYVEQMITRNVPAVQYPSADRCFALQLAALFSVQPAPGSSVSCLGLARA